MEYLFSANNLVKKYKNGDEYLYALDNVDTKIIAGTITTILGPSGSGKTTLLNMLSGLDTVTSGEIIFNDLNIAQFNTKKLTQFRRDNIGFVFQSYNLISTLTVRENIELGAYLSDNAFDVDKIIEEVGLTKHVEKYPHQLSGGQQQRVAIARVLVKNPKVIFCDEPTGALDEENGRKVLDLLQGLNTKYQTTLVMVTHNPNIAFMSHYVVHFKNGKIVKEEQNDELKSAYEIEWS